MSAPREPTGAPAEVPRFGAADAIDSDRRMMLAWEAWAKREGNAGAAALFHRTAERLAALAKIAPASPLDEESLAFYDRLAPRCHVPDPDKTSEERASDVALPAAAFVPLLNEVHRLRAALSAPPPDWVSTLEYWQRTATEALDALDASQRVPPNPCTSGTPDRGLL
jgi:hypothetical protein